MLLPRFKAGGRAFAQIAEYHPELTAFRRDLHAHPELGFEEVYTSARVREALRAAGLPIEARTKVGYCLPWPMELLDAERIQQALPNPAAPVQVHWALDSTQDALARLPGDAPDLSVVLAETQTQGRGRRGHGWASPPCQGLYLSCLKHFAGGPASLSATRAQTSGSGCRE